jgi:predicted MFS family arabinose efflux permease
MAAETSTVSAARGPFSRAERARLAILAVATAIGATGLAAGGTAGALLGADLAGSDAAAGVPLGLLVVGSAASAPLISYLTPRLGRERSLALGYFVGAVGAEVVVIAAVAESLTVLLVGSVLVGTANAAIFLTRYAAADGVRPAVRGRALGTVFFATALGAIASPLLLGPSGDLAELMGLPSLTGLYLVATAAFVIAGMTLVAASPSPVRESTPITRHELLVGLRVRGTRTSLLILGAGNFVMVAVMAVAPVHMTEHAHHHLQFVGIVISLHVAGMFAPSPISGWLADRIGPIAVATIGFAFVVVAGLSGLVVDLESGAGITALLVVLGLGWNFGIVGGSTLLTASTTPRLRPHAEGIGEVAMGLAAGLGAPIAGVLVAGGGFVSIWLAGAALAAGVGVYILRRGNQAAIRAALAASRSS